MQSRTSWGPPSPDQLGWTLDRHIFERQRLIPGATGDFTGLFQSIALAGRMIAARVHKAGLSDVLGRVGHSNVQGEEVQRLDVLANQILIRCVEAGGHVCAMASEENEDIIPIPAGYPKGKYVLLFDPLDGSSNIDVCMSIGTIFSIHRRITPDGGPGTEADCLQKGTEQVAAGYILYGSSTVLVYTTGQGVHGFTLDPLVGEFFLSHENIRIPARGSTYSVNEGNTIRWDRSVRDWVSWLKSAEAPGGPYGHRYIGTMVADFHRTLLKGGIFAYPADEKSPSGKLRLLYECAPMAFIAEAAGGAASTGAQRVLEVEPASLHARVPFFAGSKDDVADLEGFVRGS